MAEERKRFGVVTRFLNHASQFDLAFWEVKDVGGGKRKPEPGTIPMVSCFGDNRIAKAHPEFIQRNQNGDLATRDAPYFDWDCLCPSQPGVQSLVQGFVADALENSGQSSLRLDDVQFAREGYCHCTVCAAKREGLAMDFTQYRQWCITDFVSRMRKQVPGKLYFTLFPDPYPGHLENRFGVQVDTVKHHVDAFVVPIYDLAYTTTYWLEVLAQGFRDRLCGHDWFLELYGLGVDEARLIKAAQVASQYASGVLIAYDNDIDKTRRVQVAVEESLSQRN